VLILSTDAALHGSRSQCIDLRLDDASLYLTKHGFAFLQAQADLFRTDSRWRPPQLCD
jgi:hypothetical protein